VVLFSSDHPQEQQQNNGTNEGGDHIPEKGNSRRKALV
jgi:hypothetical protein